MNPMALLQMKDRFEIFQQEHPKVLPFLNAVWANALQTGTVLELKVTTPEGKELTSNIRLTENDIETIRMLFSQPQE